MSDDKHPDQDRLIQASLEKAHRHSYYVLLIGLFILIVALFISHRPLLFLIGIILTVIGAVGFYKPQIYIASTLPGVFFPKNIVNQYYSQYKKYVWAIPISSAVLTLLISSAYSPEYHKLNQLQNSPTSVSNHFSSNDQEDYPSFPARQNDSWRDMECKKCQGYVQDCWRTQSLMSDVNSGRMAASCRSKEGICDRICSGG